MDRPIILIAERNDAVRPRLEGRFLRRGFQIIGASDEAATLDSIQKESPALAILGPFPGGSLDGLELAGKIRRSRSMIPIILIVEQSSEELAIAALRAGINDYFRQPVAPEEIEQAVARCLGEWSAEASSGKGEPHRTSACEPTEFGRMVGVSPLIQDLKAYMARVARADSNVLITGETGTGKELAAELIHSHSSRRSKPLVLINCAAIPDTLVESELFGYERGAFTGADSLKDGILTAAGGGTAFFDEIGDLSPFAQAKILRAVEAKEIQRLGGRGRIPLDIRVIAATNRDLEKLTSEGSFRQDLYYRLNVASIHLPPLRDRKEDIPLLAAHYVQELNQRRGPQVEGFTEKTVEYLLRYSWPGNVRELKNLVEACFVTVSSRWISFADLPERFHKRLREAEALPPDERERVLSALLATKWNKSKAASKLHWSRMTLYRKMARYHIDGTRTLRAREPIEDS